MNPTGTYLNESYVLNTKIPTSTDVWYQSGMEQNSEEINQKSALQSCLSLNLMSHFDLYSQNQLIRLMKVNSKFPVA